MQLHIQIGALMEKHGYTNQSMADASGVPVGTVSGIRSGKIQSPSFDAIVAMMQAMGESVDALVGIASSAPPVDPDKLTEDGYTEAEIRAVLRWADSEISRTYHAVVAEKDARIAERDSRLAEKDDRLAHRTALLAEDQRRADADLQRERHRAHVASIISYAALILFVILFLVDFLLPNLGWFVR